MDAVMEPWAERLHSCMKAAGRIPADLARACKIGPGSVSGWFGKGKPTLMISGNHLVACCALLNVDPTYIMTGKGPIQSQSQPARLDGEILRLGIALVRGVLKANNVTKFDILEDADEVAQAMQYVMAQGLRSVTADNVLDFMQARAKRG